MKGAAEVFVPKPEQYEFNQMELAEFVTKNKSLIIWNDQNMHILKQIN